MFPEVLTFGDAVGTAADAGPAWMGEGAQGLNQPSALEGTQGWRKCGSTGP